MFERCQHGEGRGRFLKLAAIAEAGSMRFMEDGIAMETIFGDGRSKNSGFLGKLMGAGLAVCWTGTTGDPDYGIWITSLPRASRRRSRSKAVWASARG